MAHRKKDDDHDEDDNRNGDAAPSTNGSRRSTKTTDSCSGSSSNNNGDTTDGSQPRRRHGRASTSVLFNTGLSITLFFALIQFFDPTLRGHHGADISHHHKYSNPIGMGLREFSHGKDGIVKGQHSEHAFSKDSVRQGRERILHLLEEAGVAQDMSKSQIAKLPKWQHIVDLFGEQVIVVGKDECETFRHNVSTSDAILAVAGMFNTGTNLLDTQIRRNIRTPQKNLWQVPWGKHRMAEVKWKHTATDMEKHDKNNILPIVIIRDPFAWLQSMCSHPYAANWRHRKAHCPNLVPNSDDKATYNHLRESFTVTIAFDKQSRYSFHSLVHLWSEWYRQYLDADYPVLMVRFEDLVFQPAVVLREIADCVQGELSQPLHYQVKTSKAHGSGTDYVKAIIKTADAEARPHNMTRADLDFATQHLDRSLMNLFHYHMPDQMF